MANRQRALTPEDFKHIYDNFKAPVSRFDCGRHCAPLNGGDPVCCSTDNAVPIVEKAEWKLLKARTDLWHIYKPTDAQGKKIVRETPSSCAAIECKGAKFCERDNRTLACRAFPFFPYIAKDGHVAGLSVYWTFEDRCWVISNLNVVSKAFINECLDVHSYLFSRDREEFETMRDHSAQMRRVFTRWNRPILILTREGAVIKDRPRGRGLAPATEADLRPRGAYVSERAYKKAVADEEERRTRLRRRGGKAA